MKAVVRWLFQRSKTTLTALSLLAVALLVGVDYLTGYEMSIGVFYLFPISVMAWGVGRQAGVVFAVLCAVLWHVADVGSGHVYSSPALPYWNAAVRLGYFLSVAYLAGRLREEREVQERLARTDALTNLYNRRAFLEFADRECRRTRRAGTSLTMAYIDLDHFKIVNDQYGHGVGDELLRVVGQALQSHSRASDTVARLGGDEFAVLLPDTDLQGAKVFLEGMRGRLLKSMRARRWPVTFSIGSITFSRPVEPEEMIRRADALMYEVKQGSRNAINYELTHGESFTQATQSF